MVCIGVSGLEYSFLLLKKKNVLKLLAISQDTLIVSPFTNLVMHLTVRF